MKYRGQPGPSATVAWPAHFGLTALSISFNDQHLDHTLNFTFTLTHTFKLDPWDVSSSSLQDLTQNLKDRGHTSYRLLRVTFGPEIRSSFPFLGSSITLNILRSHSSMIVSLLVWYYSQDERSSNISTHLFFIKHFLHLLPANLCKGEGAIPVKRACTDPQCSLLCLLC